MARHLFCCFLLIGLMGCAGTGGSLKEPVSVTVREDAVNLSSSSTVRSVLLEQYSEWQGTPHRMGGMSRSGIDCSGLVQRVFRAHLGHELPRTTKYQVRVGEPVSRDQLRPGDLIFFKTGYKTRHVGIYTGASQFLHASSSQGVSLSNINNQYWVSNYWQSRRIAK